MQTDHRLVLKNKNFYPKCTQKVKKLLYNVQETPRRLARTLGSRRDLEHHAHHLAFQLMCDTLN